MFRNYCKIAWRTIVRNKAFSIINISGLAIGMASAMLIFLWIRNELSYDRFHSNISNLYEVMDNMTYDGAIQTGTATPDIMAPVLKHDVPEIDKVSRISWDQSILFAVGDKSLKATGDIVDADFLSMFSFPLIRGDAKTALADPYSVVITESLARKLFGTGDPMGKTIHAKNRGVNFEIVSFFVILKEKGRGVGFGWICGRGKDGLRVRIAGIGTGE